MLLDMLLAKRNLKFTIDIPSKTLIFTTSLNSIKESRNMAKKNTILVRLTSTGLNAKGNSTGTFFVKKRNPKKQPEKISFRKYDPEAVSDADGNTSSSGESGATPKKGMHVLFVEKKMPNPKA